MDRSRETIRPSNHCCQCDDGPHGIHELDSSATSILTRNERAGRKQLVGIDFGTTGKCHRQQFGVPEYRILNYLQLMITVSGTSYHVQNLSHDDIVVVKNWPYGNREGIAWGDGEGGGHSDDLRFEIQEVKIQADRALDACNGQAPMRLLLKEELELKEDPTAWPLIDHGSNRPRTGSVLALAVASLVGAGSAYVTTSSALSGTSSLASEDLSTLSVLASIDTLLNRPIFQDIASTDGAKAAAFVAYGVAATTLYTLDPPGKYRDRFILGALVCGLCLGASGGLSIQSTMLAVLPWTVLSALLASIVWNCCKCGAD